MDKIKDLKAAWLDQLLVIEQANQRIEAIKRAIMEEQKKPKEENETVPSGV